MGVCFVWLICMFFFGVRLKVNVMFVLLLCMCCVVFVGDMIYMVKLMFGWCVLKFVSMLGRKLIVNFFEYVIFSRLLCSVLSLLMFFIMCLVFSRLCCVNVSSCLFVFDSVILCGCCLNSGVLSLFFSFVIWWLIVDMVMWSCVDVLLIELVCVILMKYCNVSLCRKVVIVLFLCCIWLCCFVFLVKKGLKFDYCDKKLGFLELIVFYVVCMVCV